MDRRCNTFVNAAGASAGKIAAMAKINLPVEAKKRFVFVFSTPSGTNIPNSPLVVDPCGVYFRSVLNLPLLCFKQKQKPNSSLSEAWHFNSVTVHCIADSKKKQKKQYF
jgi:glycine/D-amino acid oxidase-like deaminating enzyme